MNKQNFNQSGGFPLETEVLADMQESFAIFNSLGNIAGNFSIISGCEENNGVVTNGFVNINGEVIEFRGGNTTATVIIVENPIKKEFENGEEKEVLFIRYATFGIGNISYPWANFKRPKTTIELTEDVEQINQELAQKASANVIQNLLNRIVVLENRPAYVEKVRNRGYFTLGDIAGGQYAGQTLPVSGNCLSAVVAPNSDAGNGYVDITFENEMDNVNYYVNFSTESLGSIVTDNDAGNPVFKILTKNSFRFGIYEASGSVQSVRFHFEVVQI
ncbi:hypothetical protein [Flavobacterium columnare]|uniref:Uncharacterized protein n=1 Tax=Flavobacterium columnare TaxID=996 RepID=A0AAI8CFP2_9FLAO|nr:hypothetical protein [Flavobacterium columnare]AMO19236.1 hypothetical protein UN65_01670 [Flavobacterium columnare]AUX17171.1 hypothetical protein AQ623_01735 [Flavobacterium columnare]QOG56186.1 hypothetical protein HUE29_01685 [Flavobacterium columnare]QOG58909.1 hypothetical protein HUE30_01685 [Flavobacterium columnare]QOG61631.1 hypothetical protein HUE31_01690 [Flavobacterium columnare]